MRRKLNGQKTQTLQNYVQNFVYFLCAMLLMQLLLNT